MKTSAAACRGGAYFQSLLFLFSLAISSPAARAADLFDLDFTAPETGAFQVMAGNPAVQSASGPFTDALVFNAITGGEQIRLPINQTGPGYDVQFDVLAHNLVNSDYSFGIYFDTASSRSLNLHGGQNSVYLYQSSPFLNLPLTTLANDSVYHFDVVLDAGSSAWSIAINNTSVFGGSCDAAALQSIRFGIAPWIGGAANAPNTHVALDNVRVAIVPEPSAAMLSVTTLLLCLKRFRRTFQPGK